jgi:hypothetical protein
MRFFSRNGHFRDVLKRIIEFIWLKQGCDPLNGESISIGADIE